MYKFTPTYIRNGVFYTDATTTNITFSSLQNHNIMLPFCLHYFLSLCYYSPFKKNSSCPSLLTYFIVKSMHIFFSAWSTKSKYPIHRKFTYICCYLYIIFRNNYMTVWHCKSSGLRFLRCEYNIALMQLQICCVSFLLYGLWFMRVFKVYIYIYVVCLCLCL